MARHHLKASNGKLEELVDDYADRVEYFSKGIVARRVILEDEKKYHRNFLSLQEKISSPVKIKDLGANRIQVRYQIENRWQKAIDGSTGGGSFEVLLLVEEQQSGWKIIKHQSPAKK